MDPTVLATESGRYLLTQGVLGVAVLGLCFLVYLLWRKIDSLQDELIACHKEIGAAAIKEIERSHQAATSVSIALEGHTRAMETRAQATDRQSGVLERVEAQVRSDGERTREKLDAIARRCGGG